MDTLPPLASLDVELLSAAIGSRAGGSPRVAATELFHRFQSLSGILAAGPWEIAQAAGLTLAAASRLHAALTLGRGGTAGSRPEQITSVAAAQAYLWPILDHPEQEAVALLPLSSGLRPKGPRLASLGGADFAVFDVRILLTAAVRAGASAIIVGHNHPGGDPTPSQEDIRCTRVLAQGCHTLNIRLLDHLVVGGGAWCSLAARGELPGWP